MRRTKGIFIFLLFQLLNWVVLGDETKILVVFEKGVESQDVIVSFGSIQDMKEIAHEIQSKYAYSSKEERIYALYEAFHGYHSECTSEASSYLDESSYNYQSMWSTNTMIIRNADPDCVKKLSKMNDVKTIGPNAILPLIDPMEDGKHIEKQLNHEIKTHKHLKAHALELLDTSNTSPSPFILQLTWGLDKIYVDEAWEYGAEGYYYGARGELMTGQGIVVANIDTGVRADHEALKDNHRTYAGWADGYNESSVPEDLNGHGTHTMGTICGSHGIGVAPGAQWIACRGCLSRGCDTDALLFCCNWIICPTDSSQTEHNDYKHCSTAPDVVSNSWGGGQGDGTFERCAIALRAAGIIPVWAHGNSGPECETANSPGDLPMVIGVGATDKDDNLAPFSSRGPTTDGRIKPDISAPGVQVYSAWPNGTKSYVSISGTSMATPHVAGLVALMLQRCRLNYETILNILETTAERYRLGKSDQICGDTTSDVFPNNFYGHGRVNALAAIQKVVQLCQFNNYGSGGYNSASHSHAYVGGNNYNSGGNTSGGSSYSYAKPYQSTSGGSSNYGYSSSSSSSTSSYSSTPTSSYSSSSSSPSYYGRSGGGAKKDQYKPSQRQPQRYSYPTYRAKPMAPQRYRSYPASYRYPIIPYNYYGYYVYRG